MLTGLLVVARAAQIAASILIVGTLTFQVVVVGLASPFMGDDLRVVERRLFRVVNWSLIAALLSGLSWFWLEVADMSGLRLRDSFSATAWQTVLFQTEFGRVWQFRLIVIGIAFVLIGFGLGRDKPPWAVQLVLWLLGVAFLLSLAWISHAAAAAVQPLGVLGDTVHLCAAGGWIGGLIPLAIFLTCSPVSSFSDERIMRVLRRFSTLSLCCVSILVLSGISNSWLLVDSIHALVTTHYGRLLLCKLTLFVALLALGACNRLLVKMKLPTVRAVSDLLPQIRRNVICEACLGVMVVGIVACLGITPPARHPTEVFTGRTKMTEASRVRTHL